MNAVRKHLIVISTKVDSILQEQAPDVKLFIFSNLFELNSYIESTPIRAERLFISRDALEPQINSNLANLFEILKNPYLKVQEVEYITEANSQELASVDYLIQDYEVDNWIITYGSLTREFVSGLITGSLRADDVTPKRKAVYRVRRSEFLKERLNENADHEGMDGKYEVEEDELEGIPYEPVVTSVPIDVETTCQLVNLTGLDTRDRTATALMFAQYLALTHKTVIIEKDFEYLTLTDMIKKSGLRHLSIDIKDLFDRPKEIFEEVRRSHIKLIVFTLSRKGNYNYNFISTLIYSNLKENISYLIREEELDEVSETSKYTVVFTNNVPDILKTCSTLPTNYRYGASYIIIDSTQIKETSINNIEFGETLIKDLLQLDSDIKIPIFSLNTLKGGDLHGLRSYIE